MKSLFTDSLHYWNKKAIWQIVEIIAEWLFFIMGPERSPWLWNSYNIFYLLEVARHQICDPGDLHIWHRGLQSLSFPVMYHA